MLCSHIFWKPITDNEYNQVDNNNNEIENDTEKENDAFTGFGTDNETHGVYRNGKRVLECLQKALKIADSVMDQTVNIELFIEILERYIWYFQERNEMVIIEK